jgi:hypothetical protein
LKPSLNLNQKIINTLISTGIDSVLVGFKNTRHVKEILLELDYIQNSNTILSETNWNEIKILEEK